MGMLRFGRVTREFLDGFRQWDLPSRVSFSLAGLLFVVTILLGPRLPENMRSYALIGMVGLLIAMQAIFLYANRGMVSTLTRAQRHYLAEEFAAARAELEAAQSQGQRPDYRVLTLLGNTYRQLGELELSLETLTKAIQLAPHHHYPRYGLGRTLMMSGRYGEAQQAFTQALDDGAPLIVWYDQAEALWRMDADATQIRSALQEAGVSDEPYRTLWKHYLLWRIGDANVVEPDMIKAGLPFWKAISERFAHTPYGSSVAEDVALMGAHS
jgi:tetratricopeptide (TPR) repeat protein